MDPSESCSTKEAYCPRSVHVVAFCFLLILFFFTPNKAWSFFLCYLYKRLLWEMYVCVEECFVAGVWSLNFLASSHFWIFLGQSLSHAVLIPIRCFNGMFFSPLSRVGIGVHHFSGKQLLQEKFDIFIHNKFRSAKQTSRQLLWSLIHAEGASSLVQYLTVCSFHLFPFRFTGWFWLHSSGSTSTSATTWTGKANTSCGQGRNSSPGLPYKVERAWCRKTPEDLPKITWEGTVWGQVEGWVSPLLMLHIFPSCITHPCALLSWSARVMLSGRAALPKMDEDQGAPGLGDADHLTRCSAGYSSTSRTHTAPLDTSGKESPARITVLNQTFLALFCVTPKDVTFLGW